MRENNNKKEDDKNEEKKKTHNNKVLELHAEYVRNKSDELKLLHKEKYIESENDPLVVTYNNSVAEPVVQNQYKNSKKIYRYRELEIDLNALKRFFEGSKTPSLCQNYF